LKIKEKSHSIIVHHCQFLEEQLSGNEAYIENNEKFDLKGLIVTFRHGERSPLLAPEVKSITPDCSAYFDVDRKSFEEYIDFVNSKDFRNFVTIDKSFDGISWYPERSKCVEGNLTAEGVLQIVKLGNYLRQKYINTNLFKNSPNITMSSSFFHRTFQSGIAFISSFLFPESKSIEKVFLKTSNTTYFCMNKNCTCPKIMNLRKNFEKARSDLYFRHFPELSDELDTMAALMGLQRISHPLSFVDSVLGRYACRRVPLPCFSDSKCLTVEKLREAAETSWKLVQEMFPLSKDLRKLFAAETYPISQTVATVIRKLRKQSTQNHIRVFSGHDITILPFIFTLGLNVTHFLPPYGSRLVFEIYELNSKIVINDSLFFRVLLNGVDHTNNLQFCKSFYSGLCPARYFESFVKNSLLQEIANIQSITELCQ